MIQFDSLHPSQKNFSHVGMGLPVLKKNKETKKKHNLYQVARFKDLLQNGFII